MKDTINYIIVLLSILITVIISCTDSVNNISKDQFIGMWRVNENNDILHLRDNNFILTDWTCNKLHKKGNWELCEKYYMLKINDSLLFKVNSIEYERMIINKDTLFRVYNLNP